MTPGEIRSAARIDDRVRAEARARVDGLAKPLGALGRLEDAMVWQQVCNSELPSVEQWLCRCGRFWRLQCR